jgi:hypothetical protein
MSQTSEQSRTIIRLRCENPDCEEIGDTAQAEHSRESPQVQALANAFETIADEHTAETGHETTVELGGVDAN